MRSSCETSLLAKLCAYNLHIEHKVLRCHQLRAQNAVIVHKLPLRNQLCARNDVIVHKLLSNQIGRNNAECLH